MGFTALDGIPMATRCGALDPGVLLHLLGPAGRSLAEVNDILYNKSGLLGLSGISPDSRDLLASDRTEAREAIDVFTSRIAGEVARLATTLGGLNGIVFTAGIGEHQPQIRAAVCERLTWLSLEIDVTANTRNEEKISNASSWTGPLEAITMRHGDCKSYSLAKYAGAQELGISADQVRLVIVHNRRHSEDHMVTAVHQDGEWFILDNLTNLVLRDWEKVDYEPLAVLDYKGVRRYLSAFWKE
jgi:predicted transglutaminase-like cysteine proteinase